MKYISHFPLLVFLFLLHSCSVDEFNPCNDETIPQGLLCKEYIFDEGKSNGHIQCFYTTGNHISKREYFDAGGKRKSYSTYDYEKNKPINESGFNLNDELVRQINFEYNDIDMLSAIYTLEKGVMTRHNKFEYSDKLLVKKSEFNRQALENYTSYQYYEDDNRLFKISHFAPSGELVRYTTYEYFINQVTRMNHFNAYHAFLGYDIINYASNGEISQRVSYNEFGSIVEREIFKNNSNGRVSEKNITDKYNVESKRIVYIYR